MSIKDFLLNYHEPAKLKICKWEVLDSGIDEDPIDEDSKYSVLKARFHLSCCDRDYYSFEKSPVRYKICPECGNLVNLMTPEIIRTKFERCAKKLKAMAAMHTIHLPEPLGLSILRNMKNQFDTLQNDALKSSLHNIPEQFNFEKEKPTIGSKNLLTEVNSSMDRNHKSIIDRWDEEDEYRKKKDVIELHQFKVTRNWEVATFVVSIITLSVTSFILYFSLTP